MDRKSIEQLIIEYPQAAVGYIELGDNLADINPQQAYLCYENAYFYSTDVAEKKNLSEKIQAINNSGKSVPKAAIIILGYNLKEDIRINIESIRSTTPESAREIIVVDNASVDDSVEYLSKQTDVILQANTENAGFPKGCNQGIALADDESDIFLLNNDTIMMPNTLFWLRMGLYENEKVGAVGCVTNNILGEQKICEAGLEREWYEEYSKTINIPIEEPLKYVSFIVGFAFLVKRGVLNEIGLLDEIYTPGNYEDNDYCLRIWGSGYRTAIVRNSFLVHVGGKSFGKRPDYVELLCRNKKKLESKFSIYDTDEVMRPDKMLTELMNSFSGISEEADVLEINYDLGTFVTDLKYKHPKFTVEGISTSETSKKYGLFTEKVSLKICDDKHSYDAVLGDKKYDVIIVKIHTDDDMGIKFYCELIRKHIKSEGKIALVLDNCSHYSYWMPLLTGEKTIKTVCKNAVTVREVIDAMEGWKTITGWYFAYKTNAENNDSETRQKVVELLVNRGRLERELLVDTYYIGIE